MGFKKKMFVIPMSLSLLVPTAAFAHDGHDHSGDDHSGHGEVMSTDVSSPASALRSTLTYSLGEHAFLAVEAMRKGADGSEDFEQASAALLANSDDIAAAVSSVYGEEGGAQFLEIWNSHIGYFVDYVVATGEGDEEAKQMALDELEAYKVEQAKFFDTATEGRLQEDAMVAGLTEHVDHLLMAFDSYVAGDFEAAYEQERTAIEHMGGFANLLAGAITDQFPEQFENTTPDTPAADLRAQLDYVFTEHAGLAAMAMQNGADGAENFDASAAALLANADDLSAAVASVYGEEAGEQFSEIWNSHIGYFVDYVVATGEGDTEGQEAAKAELDEYIVEQAAFLDAATEGRTPADALEQGLTEHVGQLLVAFDAYVAGDYETAWNSIREAYAHMTMPSEGLSAAIVDQFPDMFGGAEMPEEMPNTGMGGAAESQGLPYAWILAGLLLAALTSAVALRKTNKA